jgi:hypothetical protein
MLWNVDVRFEGFRRIAAIGRHPKPSTTAVVVFDDSGRAD